MAAQASLRLLLAGPTLALCFPASLAPKSDCPAAEAQARSPCLPQAGTNPAWAETVVAPVLVTGTVRAAG